MKRHHFLWLLGLVFGSSLIVAACTDDSLMEPEQPAVAESPGVTPMAAVTGTPNKQFWKQCQNNHDYADPCDWVTGNLNQTHNTWAEGDFVPKILRINNITNQDAFQMTMTYGFMKGGLITHDFLGVWNETQTGANPCADGSFNVPEFCAGGALNAIDATSNSMAALSQSAVDAACGAASQESTDMAAAITEVGAGTLVIKGINVSSINVTNIAFDGCPVSGDAEALLTMTVTPTADAVGDAKSDGLLLLMAAHVARGADWLRGGASGVKGSPYHLGLVSVDGESAGSMDLQMAAAAVVQEASKAGTKFADLDADGQPRETGEPGLEGWTIYVDYNDNGSLDSGEPSDVTDANGDYLIEGIEPGTYKVREVAQSGWTCSYPNAGTETAPVTSTQCYHEETFEGGDELTGNDFGNWTVASKSGTKFHDQNADGVKDSGEPGLSGWVIYVDYDDDGVKDSGEPSATTDGSGNYTISNVNPGTYKVREVAQNGWTCSFPNNGGSDLSSTPVTSSQCYYNETFGSGGMPANNDFGNWTTATKSGTKFEDLDADGAAQETGEGGLSGWTIYVDYDDDGVKDSGEPSATTDGSGNYTISGIDPGTWKVKEVAQSGWTCSFPNNGGSDLSSTPVTSTQCYHSETFQSNDSKTGNDFGNWTTATKSGTKFEDLDADGAAQETGEGGLSGWVIYVDYDDDGVKDSGEPSATTDGSGNYTISGIDPGTWKVKEVAQSGWTCSYPNAGSETAPVTSTQCYHSETFQSSDSKTGNDFGNWTTATKSGTKFEDLDGDGANQETGEPGLSGWTIYVDYDDDGNLDAGEPSATTDGSGNYTISGINPGTWKVKEVQQSGWVCTYPSPCEHQETFQSGDALTGNNFGNFLPQPGNSINVFLNDITVVGEEVLSGALDVQNVSSDIVTITEFIVTAEFKPSGGGGGWQTINVSGCTFNPAAPDNIAVGGTNSYTFSGCTLSPSVSGGTLRVTVQVVIFGAPSKVFKDRRSEGV